MDKHIECGLFHDYRKYGDMLPGEWAASKGIKNFMCIFGLGLKDSKDIDVDIMLLYSTTLTRKEAKDKCMKLGNDYKKIRDVMGSPEDIRPILYICINNEGYCDVGGINLTKEMTDGFYDEGFKKFCITRVYDCGFHHLMMIHDKNYDGDIIKKMMVSV